MFHPKIYRKPAATVAIVLTVLLTAWKRIATPDDRQLLHVLEKRGYRLSDSRLTGFPHAPLRRGTPPKRDSRASEIAARLEGKTDARSMRVRAAGLLLNAEDRIAVATLEKASKLHPHDAGLFRVHVPPQHVHRRAKRAS
jgi:hypothetical protein